MEDELQQQRKPRLSQFEDLEVWREARQLAQEIYCVTDETTLLWGNSAIPGHKFRRSNHYGPPIS